MSAKSKWHLIWIIGLGFVGVCNIWHSSPDLGTRWKEGRLDVIKSQLDGLKTSLHVYRARYGRYPSNDEGLRVLDNFDSRIPVTENMVKEVVYSMYRDPSPITEMYLYMYRSCHDGRAPNTPAELCECFRIEIDRARRGDNAASSTSAVMELCIGYTNNVFIASPAGILTPWLDPYMYENRTGVSNTLFRNSLVNKDRRGQYSVRVDEGVYVYSVGAYYVAADYNHERLMRYVKMTIGWWLIVLDICLILVLKTGWHGEGVIVGLLLGPLLWLLGYVLGASCYAMAPLFSYRNPRAIAKQVELIEQYHTNGVINDETYQRLRDASSPR